MSHHGIGKSILFFVYMIVLGIGIQERVDAEVSSSDHKVPNSSWRKDGEVIFPSSIQRDRYEERLGEAKTDPPPRTRTPINWNWTGWDATFFNQFLLILFIIVALILVSVLIYFAMKGNWFFVSRKEARATKDKITPARLSDLPFQIETPLKGLLEEADAAYQRGDFNSAIIYLYAHVLFELDTHRRILLQRGKTNGMYLRELRPQPILRQIVLRIVLTFELAFFGKYTITKEQFMECWNSMPQFRSILASELAATNPSLPPALAPVGAGGNV